MALSKVEMTRVGIYKISYDNLTIILKSRVPLPQICSENLVWLDLQYFISGLKILTSHIDKY